MLGKVKETKEQKEKYRIQNTIIVHLGDSDTKDCDGIIRMLYTLLVSDQTAQEKKDIIHNEYGIPISRELDEEVDYMCNISSMYIDRGIQKGIDIGMKQGLAKGIEQGALNENISTIMELLKMGLSVENIAKATHITTDEANKIISDNI